MTARPDRERGTVSRATPEQTAPGALLNLSDAHPRPTPTRKRHHTLVGGSAVLSIAHAPSVRDQPPIEHRRTARALLGGLMATARRAGIEPSRLLMFERGAPLDPDDFERLDRLVRAAQSLRTFGL